VELNLKQRKRYLSTLLDIKKRTGMPPHYSNLKEKESPRYRMLKSLG